MPLAFLSLSVLLVGLVAPPLFAHPVSPQDEGQLLVYPELLLDGAVPHRDFDTPYGPANVWVLALAFAILEPSLAVVRAVGLLQFLAIAYGVYRLARPVTAIAPALGAATLLILLPSTLAPYAWWGGVAFLVLGTALVLDEPRRRLLVGAMFLGFSLTFRQDLVLAAAGVTVACWLRANAVARRRLLLGLAIGLGLPMSVHVAIAGFTNTVRGLTSHALHSAPGRRLPLPTPMEGHGRLLWIMIGLVVWGLVVTTTIARRQAPSARQIALNALAIGVLPQALQRADTTHIRYAAAVAIPAAFLLILPGVILRMNVPTRPKLLAVVSVLALVLVVPWQATTTPVLRAIGRTVDVVETGAADVDRNGRSVPVDEDRAPDLQRIIDDLDELSSSSATLAVVPADMRRTNLNDTYIYFLAPDFQPATYYLEMNPGRANRKIATLAHDVALADVVITTSLYDDWDEPNRSSDFGSDIANRALATSHCVHSLAGPWTLWVNC